MPANLTQQYLKAEAEYRRAGTPEEELRCLQLMLQEIPKHKGTDHLQAKLKTKVSQLKKDIASEKKSAKKGPGVRIARQGAGTVVLLGGPNGGRSSLVKAMTNASPEVAPYPFTTHVPAPAMMPWKDVLVQMVDTPPITTDFLESYMYGIIRSADLVLLVLDLGSDDGVEQCLDVIERLNQTKTRLAATSYLDEDDVGLSFTETYLVANKIDEPDASARLDLFHEMWTLDFPEFLVSAEQGEGIEPLRDAIYQAMDVVRVYTKMPRDKEPDMEKPYTVRTGGTLLDLAELIHKDYVENLKFARVWGAEVHDGTTVKGDYELHDGDIVELHI